uniref:Rho-binding antiterminator n=1 Tax=Marinobacterium profundum TaxID=1714300 RepID=UPI00083471EE|nr:Rho-binding antiterminator [Marinobacterium profundum]
MHSYTPINCEVHDGFELACMRRLRYEVHWRDADGTFMQDRIEFVDLEYPRGEEYLIALSSHGEPLRIRLDRIISKLPY